MAGEVLKGRKSNNPNGRPKGQTEKSKQWNVLGEYIVGKASAKLMEEMERLDSMDYVNAMTKILSYFKPQLARTETKLNVDTTKTDITGIFPEDR